MKTLLANLAPASEVEGERSDYAARMLTLHFPMGLGLVASAMGEHGHTFSTYDSYIGGSTRGFLHTITEQLPDILMLSGFFGNYHYPFVDAIAKEVKARSPQTCIIIGGPMATTIPHLLARHTDVDYMVVGEGERTVVELMDALRSGRSASQIPGVYLGRLHGGRYVGDRTRIETLCLWPDYEAFSIDKYVAYLKTTGRCWEIGTSRGCWAECAFCKITFGRKITMYSLADLAHHIRFVVENYGIDRFSFVDDNFLNSPNRVEAFLDLLRTELPPIAWRFQGRADVLSPAAVQEMVHLGLFDISFGLESGSAEMLKRYRKRLDLDEAESRLREIRNILDIHATFIIGGPGENRETIAQTEALIRRLKLRHIYVGLLTLFPGTALYEDSLASGVIGNEDVYCRSVGPVFERVYSNISDLSDDELLAARQRLIDAGG